MLESPPFSSARNKTLRIGTRASPLALAQANGVATFMRAYLPGWQVDIVPMTTRGDQLTNQKLQDAGGKGLFTRELDAGISEGILDIAVHSLKDVPTDLPQDQSILAIPQRADPREGFISSLSHSLDTLPEGATVGTASIRREAQIRTRRSDLKIVMFRGNVGTRLAKLKAGEADATFLAMAGLERLEQAQIAQPVPINEMCPAPCQGLIAVTGIAAKLPETVLNVLGDFNDGSASMAAHIERGFLKGLDGSCRTPIAAHAWMSGNDTQQGQFLGQVYGSRPGEVWRISARFNRELSASSLLDFGKSQAQIIKEKAGNALPQFESNGW